MIGLNNKFWMIKIKFCTIAPNLTRMLMREGQFSKRQESQNSWPLLKT